MSRFGGMAGGLVSVDRSNRQSQRSHMKRHSQSSSHKQISEAQERFEANQKTEDHPRERQGSGEWVEVAEKEPESLHDQIKRIWNNHRLIHPQSVRKLKWDALLGGLILFSVIIVPYRIGFDVEAQGAADVFDIVIDIFFFMDMVVQVNTMYKDGNDLPITSRNNIAKRYAKSWFFIDFASTVPIDRIASAFAGDGDEALRSLKLIRILRLIRLLKLLRLLKLGKLLKNVTSDIEINPAFLKMYQLLGTMIFIAHLITCFWFYLGYNPEEKELPLEERTHSWFIAYAQLGSNETNKVDIYATSSQYIASMYWTIATMTAVGYGDISATNSSERVYSIVTQVVGASIFGFVIGNTSEIIDTIDLHATYMNQKMAELKAYMMDRKFPKDLQTRVKNYYSYYLQRKTIFDEDLIFEEVSTTLHKQILEESSKDVLQQFMLFDGADVGFMTAVFTKLKPVFQFPEDIICRQGSIAREVYFIQQGKVEESMKVVDRDSIRRQSKLRHLDEVVLSIHEGGSHFAEVPCVRNAPHHSSFRALIYCNLLVLAKENFDDILTNWTDASAKVRAISKLRAGVVLRVKEQVGNEGASPERHRGSSASTDSEREEKKYMVQIEEDADAQTVRERVRRKGQPPQKQWTVADLPEEVVVPLEPGAAITRRETVIQERVPPGKERDSPSKATLQKRRSLMLEYEKSENKRRNSMTRSPTGGGGGLGDVRGGGGGDGGDGALAAGANEFRFLINPKSDFRTKWDLAMGVFIVYSVLVIPFRIGYAKEASGGWVIFDWIVDGLFFSDMIVNFRTAYEDEQETMITDPVLIAKHYIRGWFFIDFFSTVPIDFVVQQAMGGGGGNGSQMRSIKMIRVLRLIRLLKLMRMAKLAKVVAALEEEYDVSPTVMRLLKLSSVMAFIAHFMSCAWFFVYSQRENFEPNWVKVDGLYDKVGEVQYLASVYWAFTTISTTGYGDIIPTNDEERIFVIICMVLGALIFGYVVGSLGSLVGKLDVGATKSREKTTEIKQYMREKNLIRQVEKKLLRYQEQYVSYKSAFDADTILSELSGTLRGDVLMFLYQEGIGRVSIFEGEQESFITCVLPMLKPEFALAPDFVYCQNQIGREMYFLVKGMVEVLLVSGEDEAQEQRFAVLEEGEFFGEMAVTAPVKRTASVRAMVTCTLWVLTIDALSTLRTYYPAVARSISQGISCKMTRLDLDNQRLSTNGLTFSPISEEPERSSRQGSLCSVDGTTE